MKFFLSSLRNRDFCQTTAKHRVWQAKIAYHIFPHCRDEKIIFPLVWLAITCPVISGPFSEYIGVSSAELTKHMPDTNAGGKANEKIKTILKKS